MQRLREKIKNMKTHNSSQKASNFPNSSKLPRELFTLYYYKTMIEYCNALNTVLSMDRSIKSSTSSKSTASVNTQKTFEIDFVGII